MKIIKVVTQMRMMNQAMSYRIIPFLLMVFIGIGSMVNISSALAKNVVTLKIGVLTPKGASWSNALEKLAQDVEKSTNGEVIFKIFYGGVLGDESKVLRLTRAGQTQGGIFTGRTLGEVNGDVRIMEVPFTFMDNREKAFNTLEKLTPFFNEGFKEKKFKNLGFFELGLVYLITTKNADGFDKLRGVKIWAWEGDMLAASFIEAMNLISVPIPLPDVLASLSTGVIEAAYASPLAILAMQWQTKVKYLIDFPLTYSIGAFLVQQDAWNKVPEKYKKLVEDICQKHIKQANEATIRENVDALKSIKDAKINFLKFPASDIAKGKQIRQVVISKLKDKLFSAKVIELMDKNLSEGVASK